ncbi:hypothetical protein GIB67_021479 [Kingdonia uniflora]|uniref:Reverse transcriptase zinc-binding domain-containing protein n=1 Tax=Kingdonia uniflora TaxID=39325 RepID=A0A7J7L9N0_9MAGN|nr:hypothetical protein GIB67_021479 [Kingdonia uniflora]
MPKLRHKVIETISKYFHVAMKYVLRLGKNFIKHATLDLTPAIGNNHHAWANTYFEANSRTWDTHLFCSIFHADIADKITAIPLSRFLDKDVLRWKQEKNGILMVRSAHNYSIRDNSNADPTQSASDVEGFTWDHIWNMTMPFHIQLFLWKAIKNGLPTKTNLWHEQGDWDSNCPRCGHEAARAEDSEDAEAISVIRGMEAGQRLAGCASTAAWKLHYYQWAMQIFKLYNMSEGACQFALAALEQVDKAISLKDDRNTTEVTDDTAVMCIMPQPMAESKSNREIYIWSIPPLLNLKRSLANEKEELPASQNIPIYKLNLGYKMDKSPIISLKWVYGDGKSSRLYVNGSPGTISSNSFQDYNLLAKNFPPVLPLETISKDGSHLNIAQFTGFSKIKNLYITGQNDGTINFWDVTYPLLLPISSMKQQSEEDHSINGNPVTALYFDITSRVLVTGNQAGMVRIFKFKSEPFPAENNLFSLQGSTKKGNTHFIHSVKLVKVNGAVLSINLNRDYKHFAVGSDQGYMSSFSGFETCKYHGFEKKVLVVATKDSSIMTLESDTRSILSVSAVHPKKLSRAIFVQSLDIADSLDVSKGNFDEDSMPKQSLILLCNEKSVYLYSLIHAVQGIKKVQYKKKFHGTSCCWASTFYNHDSSVALILLFTNDKLQIR